MQPWYQTAPPLPTSLDHLVNKNCLSVEQFLDETTSLSLELKNATSRVSQHFLKNPVLARQLVDLLTREFHSDQRRHKYGFLSYQLLECQSQALALSFFRESGPQETPIDHMLAYLADKTELLPSGYFLKLIHFLLVTQLKAFLDHVYSKPEIFTKLLKKPHEHKLCQSVQYLLNIDRSKEDPADTLARTPLREQVVDQIFQVIAAHKGEGVVENFAMMLCETVDKQGLIASGFEMMGRVSDNQHLRVLFDTLLNDKFSSAWAAANVLISLVNHMAYSKVNQEQNFFQFSESQSELLQGFSIVGVLNQFVVSICDMLRRPCPSLHSKVVELVRAGVRLNSLAFLNGLKEGKFFELMFQVFYKHEYFNIFHAQVEKLFNVIFNQHKVIFELYKEYFFCDIDIIALSTQFMKPGSNLASERHKGYFGHIIRIVKVYSNLQTASQAIIIKINEKSKLWGQLSRSFVNPYNDWTSKDLGSLDITVPPFDTAAIRVTNMPKKISKADDQPSQKELDKIVTDLPVKSLIESDRLPVEEALSSGQVERQPNTRLQFNQTNNSPSKMLVILNPLPQSPVKDQQTKFEFQPQTKPDIQSDEKTEPEDQKKYGMPRSVSSDDLFDSGRTLSNSVGSSRPSLIQKISDPPRRSAKSPSPFSKRQRREMWTSKEDERVTTPNRMSASQLVVSSKGKDKDNYEEFRDRLGRSSINLSNLRVKFTKGPRNELQARPCRKITDKDKLLLDLLQVSYR